MLEDLTETMNEYVISKIYEPLIKLYDNIAENMFSYQVDYQANFSLVSVFEAYGSYSHKNLDGYLNQFFMAKNCNRKSKRSKARRFREREVGSKASIASGLMKRGQIPTSKLVNKIWNAMRKSNR